jgi:hypothetical protein
MPVANILDKEDDDDFLADLPDNDAAEEAVNEERALLTFF